MDKFQKYYLSLLLVVVYTNLAARVNCGSVENEDCKKTCEIFDQISEYQKLLVSQNDSEFTFQNTLFTFKNPSESFSLKDKSETFDLLRTTNQNPDSNSIFTIFFRVCDSRVRNKDTIDFTFLS